MPAVIDTNSEDWRRECEARHVCNLPDLQRRREYILGVRRQRGDQAADQLQRDVQSEWVKIVALREPKKQTALKPVKRARKKRAAA